MKKPINSMRLEIAAVSANESFARGTVAAFASQANPTLDEINDIKTAISEAVTNCVVHAYAKKGGTIIIACELFDDSLSVTVSDCGIGIKDVGKALEPFYTTRPDEERSGMGFTVMQSFMDTLDVNSKTGFGTTVTMQKFFAKSKAQVVGGE
jgi:stage II sporulation protein AB (anti-sigma F factor)